MPRSAPASASAQRADAARGVRRKPRSVGAGRLPAVMSSPGAAQRTVLVVDDEPMLRNLLSRLLRMEGYDVLEAEDGQTALDVVAREMPDLVLLDVMMPARDGLDVLGDLRKTSDIPV